MTISQKQLAAYCTGVCLVAASANFIVSAPHNGNSYIVPPQQQHDDSTVEEVCVTTQQEDEVCDSSVAATAAQEDVVPLYLYASDVGILEYDSAIQEEIYRQWSEFDGILPDYEFILSFWISESGLNPYAVNYNDDGTCDIGIPQINTVTIQEAYAQGWMDYTDDIYDLETQIHVGLCVLNHYCEECPGGDYPYYRAVRAYGMGIGGLEYAESVGDYGQYDAWTEVGGTWYPGKYGVILDTAAHLIPVPETDDTTIDNFE